VNCAGNLISGYAALVAVLSGEISRPVRMVGMMDTVIPPGCWLGFEAVMPKDEVLARAVAFFGAPLDKLEWKWTHGAWLVRPKQETKDADA